MNIEKQAANFSDEKILKLIRKPEIGVKITSDMSEKDIKFVLETMRTILIEREMDMVDKVKESLSAEHLSFCNDGITLGRVAFFVPYGEWIVTDGITIDSLSDDDMEMIFDMEETQTPPRERASFKEKEE